MTQPGDGSDKLYVIKLIWSNLFCSASNSAGWDAAAAVTLAVERWHSTLFAIH